MIDTVIKDTTATGPTSAASDAGGNTMHVVRAGKMLCFEAADKYVLAFTTTREDLIGAALRQLLPRLPPGEFEPAHRAVLVHSETIASVQRKKGGKLHLKLRGCAEKISVTCSRQSVAKIVANCGF